MRFIDLCFSALGLVLLFPLFLPLAILLKFTGEREIFYRQERIGLNGKPFFIIKFATMLKNSPNMGSGTITSKSDARILPVGKILRKTKINELPQLINVLCGDMSIIGPRPHVKCDLAGVEPNDLEKILLRKPGISGLGSIVLRDEEAILQSFDDGRNFYDAVLAPYKSQLELWYCENCSIYLNILLIFATVFIVCGGRVDNIFLLFKDLPRPNEELSAFIFPTND